MSEFISKGKPLMELEEKSLPEFILSTCEKHLKNGRTEYLIDGSTDKRRYFKDLDWESRRVASHLYKEGFRKGDIAIYSTFMQYHQILFMMGIWRANGIARALYIEEDPETILEKVKESNAKWVFCQSVNAQVYKDIQSKLSWKLNIVICDNDEVAETKNIQEYYDDPGDKCPELQVTLNDLAIILSTSGTTGSSKGVAHTHQAVIRFIQLWGSFSYSYPEPNLTASKGTHISGVIMPLCALYNGCTSIVLPKVDKHIIIETVHKYKPKFAFAFATFLLALGSEDAKLYDMSSVETILAGGSQITEEIKQGFRKIPNLKTIIVAYGLTENPVVTTNWDSFNRNGLYPNNPEGTVGLPYPGGEVKIIDLETLQTLPANSRGEVCSRSEYLLKNYHNMSNKTSESFIANGWFRTGDVGYLDENGFLFIVDRAKEIFKYYNDHISPTDLERVIDKHPEVKEVCVVPLEDEGGHVPRAFVVLRNKPSNLLKIRKEIFEFANAQLANYKKLRGGLFIIDEMPVGKTGKVTRNLVAKLKPPKDQTGEP